MSVGRREEGVAVLIAMMAMLLMTALGAALIMTTRGETMIASNFGRSAETLYAAETALERAIFELRGIADWNGVLAGSVRSAFVDGPPRGTRQLQGGALINLAALENLADCDRPAACTAADLASARPWGSNNPRWKLFSYGPLNRIVSSATAASTYVVVLVADDVAENDGDPGADGSAATNPGRGVISLRAEGFGSGGAHKVIELTLSRTQSAGRGDGYSGQRGRDDQHRSPPQVQTPGKALAMEILPTAAGGIE